MESVMPQCVYRTSIKACIFDTAKKYLLVQEDNGSWELPGGGLDFGENPRECLAREIFEEMGLHVTSVSKEPLHFFTALHPTKGVWIANVVYSVILENLDFTPSKECVEIRFFTPAEALNLPNLSFNVKKFFEDL